MDPYWLAKTAQRCTYPRCPLPPATGNCQCDGHMRWHRERNKRWKRGLKMRREQLRLAIG